MLLRYLRANNIVTNFYTIMLCYSSNEKSIPEEIKSRLRSGSACYNSVQNLLSSRLLSKNLRLKYIEL